MVDFYQNGIITTLHNLHQRPVEDMEKALKKFSRKRPMTLILPSLYSELEGEALPNIVNHLSKVDYLSEIVIGLDRADEKQYRHALQFFKPLNQNFKLLWNDGPRLRKIDKKLRKEELAPMNPGKGRNVWYCMGYVLSTGTASSVALHDCDILTYDRGLLARLFYPVADSSFNYEFCKGYYARIADGAIHGRVTRLLVTMNISIILTVFAIHLPASSRCVQMSLTTCVFPVTGGWKSAYCLN
jgi:glucosyl-3-phosphoglycerate synthase